MLTIVLVCVLLLCQDVSARSLIRNNGTSRTSITLGKNPKWEPYTKTNTSQLAGVYSKYGIPMSANLQSLWNEEKSERRHHSDLNGRDEGDILGEVTASSGG